MSLVVNNNMMAANTARNLNAHYGRLQTSTQRLSSGMRINSAADDAAGLAIRELQRADIAALHQGARNANDAISMIQTADGALGVIDEKLIRLKELAEQAATGTYDSTQRLMIESEYQQMASEITRIANATDFNGMKLLDGTLSSDTHDGTGMKATGKMKIHFGTGNDSAEDYYYITIGNCTAAALGVGNSAYLTQPGEKLTLKEDIVLSVPTLTNGGSPVTPQDGYINEDKEAVPSTDTDITDWGYGEDGTTEIYDDGTGTFFGLDGTFYIPDTPGFTLTPQGKVQKKGGTTAQKLTEATIYEDKDGNYHTEDEITPGITIEAGTEVFKNAAGKYVDAAGKEVTQADGTLLTAADIEITTVVNNVPASAFTVSTQEAAQKALVGINAAIVSKDKIRAHLGAMQNRLENTITNLNVQAENLQAAESRISDVDVATEMTQFVRNQILTQSAVAMLGQANSLPQMAMQLIGG